MLLDTDFLFFKILYTKVRKKYPEAIRIYEPNRTSKLEIACFVLVLTRIPIIRYSKYVRKYYINRMIAILKTISKGQITIPAKWRKKFDTNQFVAVMKEDKLEIKPLILEKEQEVKEFTVFDAIRDNKGKGMKAKDLVNILKKTV